MEQTGRCVFQLRGEYLREHVDEYVFGRATVRLDALLDARRAVLDRLRRGERVR